MSDAAFVLLARRLSEGAISIEAVLVTALPGLPAGTRWILDEAGNPLADPPPEPLVDPLARAARDLSPSRRVARVVAPLDQGEAEVYLERWAPEPRVLIFGGGHVGRALVGALRDLGFRLLVAEDRPYFARPERFEAPVELVFGPLPEAAERAGVGGDDYVVIATRGHREDLTCLRACLARGPFYLGLLGSRRKLREFRRILAGEGIPERVLDRVRCPVGLAIGAETPAEIGVAVAAELVSVRSGRDPGPSDDKCPQPPPGNRR